MTKAGSPYLGVMKRSRPLFSRAVWRANDIGAKFLPMRPVREFHKAGPARLAADVPSIRVSPQRLDRAEGKSNPVGGRLQIVATTLLALAAGSCTSTTSPQLPPAAAPTDATPPEKPLVAANTASSAKADVEPPATITVLSKSTPTDTYEVVARGVLGCWFGAAGPLKPSHVFHAEAASPADGGAAEIVLHERDISFRDQRGARAFRIAFEKTPAGAKVDIANLKMAPALGEAMVKDVGVWVAGGSGCVVRTLYPPPPAPAPAKGKAKTKSKATAKPAGQP